MKRYEAGQNRGLERGVKAEQSFAAEKVRSIKVFDGSGTEKFVLEIAAKSIERDTYNIEAIRKLKV